MNAFRHFRILLALALVLCFSSALPVYAVGMTKGFSPNPINPGDTSMMTIIVFNDTNTALTSVAWTDNMPVDMTIQSSPLPTNSCGGTLTAVPGSSTVTLSGGSVVAQVAGVAGQCSVVIPVKTSVAPGYGSTNTILAGSLTTTPSYTNALLSTTLTTNLFAAPTLSTNLDRSLIYLGEGANLTINIINTDTSKTLTQAGWAYTLPTGLQVNGAATNNGLCGTPTVTATTGTTAIALSAATIAPSATCAIVIPITGNTQGNYTINLPAGVITSYQNATNASPSSQAIAVQSFSASKSFTPASVKTNQVSVMSIAITSKAAYNNLAFTDDFSLQTGLVVAPTPNAVITGTGCTGTVTATPGSQVVSLSAGSIPAGTFLVPSTCTVSVNVVVPSNLNIGTKTNTMAIGSIASGAASNINAASAALTVTGYTAPTLTQSLSTTTSFVGQVINLLVNVKNNDATTFTNVGWSGTLPTGLAVAGAVTFSAGCTGTPVATVTLGSTPIALSGASIATGATCTATIPVTATQQGAIAVAAMPIGTVTNNQGTSNIVAAPAPSVLTASTFTVVQKLNGATPTATMSTNTATKLRIEITNKSTDTYHNLSFTDSFIAGGSNLPATFTLINPANAVTTCNATGTPTVIAGITTGATSFTFSGGFLAAGNAANVTTTCYVEVDVQATAAIASKINAIPSVTALADGTGILTSGLNTAASASVANLTITAAALVAPTISTKTFTPTSVVAGSGVTTLQISVKNNDLSTTLTNVTWTDTFPVGMVWTGGAITYTACGTGSVTFDVTNSIATLGGGVSLAPAGICTASIPVKTTLQGVLSNTIPINAAAGSVSNDQGIHNTASPTATLTSTSITATKAFRNATDTATVTNMHVGDTFKLKITITNPSTTESYNSLSFTDSFANYIATVGGTPALQIAATPNANTTCTAGSVLTPLSGLAGSSAVAGSQSITLASGVLGVGASSSCYVIVDVTAIALMAAKTNTIAAGTAASSAGAGITALSNSNASQVWNTTAVTANLAIIAIVPPTISTKTFTPTSVVVGSGVSTLKISVKNNDLSATLTNVTWTDTFPAGVVWTGGAITYLNCGTGSVTFDVTNSIATLGGGVSLAPGVICDASIPVKTTQQGVFTNTIPINAAAGSVSNDQLVHNTASPTATLTSTSITASKAFRNMADTAAVTTMHVGDTFKLKITISNPSTTESYNSLSFTDSFANFIATVGGTPALQIAATPNANTTCTAGSVLTPLSGLAGSSAVAGSQSITLASGVLGVGVSSCYVIVDVTALASMTVKANTIAAGTAALSTGAGITALSNSNASQIWNTAAPSANLTITPLAAPTFSAKTFAPTSVFMGANSTLTISVTNNDAITTLNNVTWTDTFPWGLVVAGTPTATKNAACGAATFAPLAGATSLSFSGGVIAPGATCTVTVNVTGTSAAGSYTNSIGIGAITTTEGVTNTVASPAPALWLEGLQINKNFSVSPVAIGAVSRLTINVTNNTTVNHPSIVLTDDFSAQTGMVIANPPNVVSSGTGCTLGTVTATAGTGVVSLSGFALAGGTATVATVCTVQVDVVGNISGTKTNTILGTGLVALPSQWSANATANLVVNPATLTVAKTFTTSPVTAPVSIRANGTDVALMRITVTNPNAVSVNSLSFTDTFPASMTGMVISNASAPVNTCGGTLTATAGSNVVSFVGTVVDTIAAGNSCYVEIPVVSTTAFMNKTNSVTVTAKTSMAENITATPATANLSANALSVTHAFGAATLIVGANTAWTTTITNNSGTAQTAVAFSDTFTSVAANALLVGTVPTVVNTCGGTVTATAGTSVVTLAGGTIPANSSCSISVNMVGNGVGTITNNAVSVTSSQQTTAAVSNNVSLAVINPSVLINTVTKAFTPASVTLLQNSTASIGWKSSSVPSTVNPVVTDNLPVGLTVAAVPNVTASCVTPAATPTIASTTVSPARDRIVVALTITQVQNQVCTVTFDVTPTKPGTLTNALAKGDILSADGTTAANTVTASANLTVTNVLTIGKTFQPTDLSFSGVSMLTITLTNPETVPLTGASLRDNLPATTPNDLIVAGSPYTTAVATTDCTVDGSQSTALVTATAGTRIIQLTGGVIPSKQGAVDGVCHITVPVKLGSASPTGPATNTIPIGTGVVGTGLTTTEGRFNINQAQATINFVAPTLGIAKSFNPPSVSGGSVSQLTVTITNNNNFIQTGLAFADVMPVGMTVGAPANPQTTCTGGTFTGATTGSASWSFSGGVVAASGTCTVSLNVTMNVRTTLTNTIPLNALTSANGGKNNIQVGTANLTNLAGLSIAKAFTPNPAVVNQPIRLTFSITNSSDTTNLTGLGFVDDLTLGGTQTGLTVSPTPNVSNACGGTIVASGTTISLSGGTLAAQTACVIAVDVVTNTVRSYVNTVPILALTSTQGLTNAIAGTDTLPVYAGIKALKQLSPTNDTGRFVLTLSPAAPSGVSVRTNVGHDATPSAVSSFFANEGVTYTVTESGQGATSLANYLTTWACRNADNTLLSSGSGTVATVTPPTTASGATKNQQDISCTFTNVNRVALVTVNSVSNGGVGSFTFTGGNGLPVSASTITTTTAGVSATSVALTDVLLTTKGIPTVITEGALPGGFVLSGASCTGLQGADTATLVGSVLTIPATSIVDGARISCTFTHSLPAAKTLTLRKQWVGATLNDAVNITATGLTPLASVATIAGKLDTGTAQAVSSGAVITLAETFSVGSAANYAASLACTGTAGLSGNVLTVGVADTAIVCTQTNTFVGPAATRITGTVFKDTGAGGGTANNGVQDGAEVGIAGVTITANQASCASTVCATAITDGAGNYTLVLPSTVTGVITLTETNLNGMLSTGGSAGTSAGTYTRSTDTVTAFSVVAGTSYTGLNFGDVPDNQFVTDGAQAAMPGTSVFYPHHFVAGTAGSVAFGLTRVSSPAITGWSELIYEDTNCNAMIDAGEAPVAASVAVVAGQTVCLLVKEFVPANVPVNAQNALTVTTNFTSTFANPTGAVNFSYVRHDTTTVGQASSAGLSLVKSVSATTALPGSNIVYTVTYTNSSSGPLSSVVINDATPAYTTYQSASCGALPLNFTGCSIAAPAVGGTGSIVFTFTGTLAPASTGAVNFTVQVQP